MKAGAVPSQQKKNEPWKQISLQKKISKINVYEQEPGKGLIFLGSI